jgi:hypothetical protein
VKIAANTPAELKRLLRPAADTLMAASSRTFQTSAGELIPPLIISPSEFLPRVETQHGRLPLVCQKEGGTSFKRCHAVARFLQNSLMIGHRNIRMLLSKLSVVSVKLGPVGRVILILVDHSTQR